MSEFGALNIASCRVHGLHGERTECFVCGGPVDQVEVVRLDAPLEFIDPDLTVGELIRWAERYGDPEVWVKRAQAAHVRAEAAGITAARLRAALERLQIHPCLTSAAGPLQLSALGIVRDGLRG